MGAAGRAPRGELPRQEWSASEVAHVTMPVTADCVFDFFFIFFSCFLLH